MEHGNNLLVVSTSVMDKYLFSRSIYFVISVVSGFTSDIPSPHIPDEWPYSWSQGKITKLSPTRSHVNR